MKSEPRILVLGAGSAGTRHARNLTGFGAAVEIVDIEGDPAAAGVPSGFDGVVVATPTALHREHAFAALATGAAVLVEKPLAVSTEGLDDLVERAADRLTVGYNLRLHPPVQRVSELVAAGAAGSLVSVRLWFGSHLPDWRPGGDYRTAYSAVAALGGGVLWDASHEIDLLQWLFGAEWVVEGAVVERRTALEIDVEDTVVALLRSPEGVPAVIGLDYASRRYRRGIEIVGTDGTVTLDWGEGTIRVDRADAIHTEDASVAVDGSYRATAAAFLALVRGDAGPVVTAHEGAATVRLCARIRKAANG